MPQEKAAHRSMRGFIVIAISITAAREWGFCRTSGVCRWPVL